MWFLRWYLALAAHRQVWDPQGGVATNRLLYENGDGILLEDGSGDLALE